MCMRSERNRNRKWGTQRHNSDNSTTATALGRCSEYRYIQTTLSPPAASHSLWHFYTKAKPMMLSINVLQPHNHKMNALGTIGNVESVQGYQQRLTDLKMTTIPFDRKKKHYIPIVGHNERGKGHYVCVSFCTLPNDLNKFN